ncbi:MAG: ankyrin repeat domain-containing protein [Candidatus Aminicenantes bacterium]|nr:ankyrin repeat domain-containing protein [Candidatus Aminicenantes bacterium]
MNERMSLIEAAEKNDVTWAEKLLREGVAVEERNAYGQTALHLAAGFGHIAIMALLLEQNADIEAVAHYGHRPLMLAGSNRCHWKTDPAGERTVAFLLNYKPLLDARDRYGWTALHHAAYDGHARTVERLLLAGADWHIKNEKKEDPLTLAVKTPQRHPYEDRMTILPGRKEEDSMFDVVKVLFAAENKHGLHWKRRQSLSRLALKYRCPEAVALFS